MGNPIIRRLAVILGLCLVCGVCLFAQKAFKQYHTTIEHDDTPLPPDWQRPAEWIFARLKYRDIHRFELGDSYYWTMDYPQGDRLLLQGVRRLTSIDVMAVEQVVDLDDRDDIYNWPFLYGVEVGMWDFTDEQAALLRKYLLRGGFLMVDDFHGEMEWENFAANMALVFPDRDIVDLTSKDLIFHTVGDVNQLVQIPSIDSVRHGVTAEKGGVIPRWRAIRDDNGRLMVVICHNMDLGDAVEWSDSPGYPEHYASIAYRVLTNYAVYSLTH
ncbi:MAG: DUF4159 domain-containing protein [Acidobacteriota bacterium]